MIKNTLIGSLIICLAFVLLSAKTNDRSHYYIVHYTTGAKWNKKFNFEEQPFSAAHSRHLAALKKNGTIVFGMRYSDKGMICIKTGNIENAKALINSDTAVIKQLFRTDIQEADVFYDGCIVADADTGYKKVTGIGGIFFKSSNVKETNEWYYKHLGITRNDYGTLFEFRTGADPNVKGYLQWSPFNEKTKYFEPSQKQFMINYRVQDLERLKNDLEKEGVKILDKIEVYEYGKFLHIMDNDGNKIELWEPVDSDFTRMYEGKTTK
jgi:predicted enzyme related to lactoylglutathione lyase